MLLRINDYTLHVTMVLRCDTFDDIQSMGPCWSQPKWKAVTQIGERTIVGEGYTERDAQLDLLSHIKRGWTRFGYWEQVRRVPHGDELPPPTPIPSAGG